MLEAAAPFAKEDPECTAIVLDQLAREGIAIRANVKIARIEKGRGSVRAILAADASEEKIEGSHLLVAAGRRANVQELGLDDAGIAHEQRGVVVDKGLRTSQQARLCHWRRRRRPAIHARRQLPCRARDPERAVPPAGLADDDLVPRVTFTDPELAHAGLTEAQARERHRKDRGAALAVP